MSNILYRPVIQYEKNYETDDYYVQSAENTTVEVSPVYKADTLLSKMKRVETLVKAVPSDIAKAIAPIITAERYIYNQIPEDHDFSVTLIPGSSLVIESSGETASENPNSGWPPNIFSQVVPTLAISVKKEDPLEVIENEYVEMMAKILTEHLDTFQRHLNAYVSNLAVIMSSSGVTNGNDFVKSYDLKTTDLANKDLYHLSDAIVRSQVMRDQKQRLLQKTHSEAETSSQVKACKVSKDLMKRYTEANPVPNGKYLDVASNMILCDSVNAYEKKYEENLSGLYKYMNSSVILINECLSMFVQEAQAKAILVEKEGIKI